MHKLSELSTLVIDADPAFFDAVEDYFRHGEIDPFIKMVNRYYSQWTDGLTTGLTSLSQALVWLQTYRGHDEFWEILPTIASNENRLSNLAPNRIYSIRPDGFEELIKKLPRPEGVKEWYEMPQILRALKLYLGLSEDLVKDNSLTYDFKKALLDYAYEAEKGVSLDGYLTRLEHAMKLDKFDEFVEEVESDYRRRHDQLNATEKFARAAIGIIPGGRIGEFAMNLHEEGLENAMVLLRQYDALRKIMDLRYNDTIHEMLLGLRTEIYLSRHLPRVVASIQEHYMDGMDTNRILERIPEAVTYSGIENFERIIRQYHELFVVDRPLANRLYSHMTIGLDEQVVLGLKRIGSNERARIAFMAYLERYKPDQDELNLEPDLLLKASDLMDKGYEWTPKGFYALYSDSHQHRHLAVSLNSLGAFITRKAERL